MEMTTLDLQAIELLADWWLQASYRVVLTGAGISTESGLPDFRSPQGLWKGRDPQQLASLSALYHNTKEFYEFYRMRLASMGKANPNNGHRILACLQKEMLLNAIITQNVDGLHQRAGAGRVIELHGSLRETLCLSCRHTYPSAVLTEMEIPTCSQCGGLLKPGVILFGESLPPEAIRQADMETRRAKVFLVVGSSLEVSPANYYPLLARDVGAKVVIINMERTYLDDQADLLIRGKAGEILGHLYQAIHHKQKGTS